MSRGDGVVLEYRLPGSVGAWRCGFGVITTSEFGLPERAELVAWERWNRDLEESEYVNSGMVFQKIGSSWQRIEPDVICFGTGESVPWGGRYRAKPGKE